MKKVSIKDVALKAGVSTALVSYVLNGKHTNRINKGTAEKIKQVVDELNYRPNQIAQSLKLKRTKTLGLIVSNIANPFSSFLARQIENEASKKGFSLLIGSSDENVAKSRKLIDTFLNRQVDGFIIAAAAGTETQIEYLQKNNIPLLLIDRYFPDNDSTSITVDNESASFKVVEHLIQQDYRNIAVISFDSALSSLTDRVTGALDAFKKYKVTKPLQHIFYVNEDTMETDLPGLLDNITGSVDALYLTNNILTIRALKHLIKRKIKIPSALGIATFDQTDAFDLFSVPITYVHQPLEELGKMAMEEILKEIEHIAPKGKKIVLPTELIVRASSLKK